MQHKKSRNSAAQMCRRSGFTLIQLVIVLAIISILAATLMTVFRDGRLAARRAQCDVNLKAITIALDAYRQENGRFPQTLHELVDRHYLQSMDMLRCPNDPNPNSDGYEPYYIIREPRDTGELPIVVCPFHENEGYGAQAYKGTYTKQYTAVPAVLTMANDTTVQRPGEDAEVARQDMELHGGDTIRTGAAGQAQLRFYDGSTTELTPGTEIKVLQSFIEGQAQNAPLFTLLRQVVGDSHYEIVTGNKFDIVTPTATAGALGTKFDVILDPNDCTQTTQVKWIQGTVALTTLNQTIEVAKQTNTVTTSKDTDKKHKPRKK